MEFSSDVVLGLPRTIVATVVAEGRETTYLRAGSGPVVVLLVDWAEAADLASLCTALARSGRVRPYLWAGAGWSTVITGVDGTELTLHGALGLKWQLSRRLDLRGELPVRAVDPSAGTTADFTGGITFRP